MSTSRSLRRVVATLVLGLAALGLANGAAARHPQIWPVGSWYLALDATPYGLPAELELSLPGLAMLNADRTMLILDGGDFGGQPFLTRDSAQVGRWQFAGATSIRAVTHFLQADAMTGELAAWYRVQLTLDVANANTMTGTVNVAVLRCTEPAPLQIFSCPDPVDAAADFVPDGPPDVPVTLRRLPDRI